MTAKQMEKTESMSKWSHGLVDPLTVVDADGRVVAEVSHDLAHHKGREVAGEIARLIAATLDLLEALERHSQASATNPCHCGPSCRCIWHMTEAAIKKARGL